MVPGRLHGWPREGAHIEGRMTPRDRQQKLIETWPSTANTLTLKVPLDTGIEGRGGWGEARKSNTEVRVTQEGLKFGYKNSLLASVEFVNGEPLRV